MNIPPDFLAEVRRLEAQEADQYFADGGRYEPAWSLAEFRRSDEVVYPPFGFVAFPDLLDCENFVEGDIGQGDYNGFYWPIGREEQPPLVAKTAHHNFGMIPIASSLEKYQELDAWAKEEYGRADDDHDDDDEEEDLHQEVRPAFAPDALAERLAIDPDSPYLQMAVADLATSEGDFDRAEALYRAALDRIPEYTATRIGLALLLRRNRRGVEALGHMLKALRSPIPLWGTFWFSDEAVLGARVNRNDYRRKFLYWIQRIKPKAAGEHVDDPLYQARDRLTFASGVKETDDYKIFDELIDAYIARGDAVEAVGLTMVYNELMAGETISFRERNAETETTQRARLMKSFQAAGLGPRADWLASLPDPG